MLLYRLSLLFVQLSFGAAIAGEDAQAIKETEGIISRNNATDSIPFTRNFTAAYRFGSTPTETVTRETLANNIKQQSSALLSPAERLLSRRRRFLLFPKGAFVKFTVQLSRSIIALYPRGISFVVESAVYYPVPGARIDLIPKRLRKPTTTTPKPTGTTPQLFVCIPGSLICYKAKKATSAPKVQRLDENIDSVQWLESNKNQNDFERFRNLTNYYNNKYNVYNKNYKYNSSKYHQLNTQWSNSYQHNNRYNASYAWKNHRPLKSHNEYPDYVYRPTPASRWTKWTTTGFPRNHVDKLGKIRARPSYYRSNQRVPWPNRSQSRWYRQASGITEDHPTSESIHFDDLEPYTDWPLYHSHRDRRQLFHHFEALSQTLGLDVRSCIVRAICESKRYLLPPGYSLFHDIVRLIFTLPTINGMTDEYSRAMHADYETCDAFLRPKCPLNILEWILR